MLEYLLAVPYGAQVKQTRLRFVTLKEVFK